MEQIIYALISVTLVSLISVAGAVFMFFNNSTVNKITKYLVAFAAGAFLGEILFHIFPEATKDFDGFTPLLSLLILIGFLTFLSIEKMIHWRHCHHTEEEKLHHAHSPIGIMSLMGDLVHNLLDGVVIGASFLIDIKLGLVTTIAIISHEIPQEIADFGILLHSGYTKQKALLLNFIVGLTAILGTVIAIITGSSFQNLTQYIMPITAGGFLYMATVDLIPELKDETGLRNTASYVITMIVGITVMYLMKFLE